MTGNQPSQPVQVKPKPVGYGQPLKSKSIKLWIPRKAWDLEAAGASADEGWDGAENRRTG